MTDDTDSKNSSSTPYVGGEDVPEALVAFADCEIVNINSQMSLVINRHNGNQLVISPDVCEALKTCTDFKTIADHARYLAETRSELKGQESMAVSALEQLNAAEILLHASDVAARLAQEPARELPPTRVFILTCDRPSALERLLQSLRKVSHLAQYDNLFVVDDSRDPQNRDVNRELVGSFNRTSAREIHYIGVQEQDALIHGLVKRLSTQEQSIRFLLDARIWQGFATYGRSRNLCLLFSVGFRTLMMDDDVLLESMLSPIKQKGVSIDSNTRRQAGFFQTEAEMFSAAKRGDFDPLSEHARFLGSSLGRALKQLNGENLKEEQLLDCKGLLTTIFMPDSPVLVTQNGTFGDPGTGSVHWGITTDDTSLRRLISEPQGVRAALENRLAWFGCTRPNFFKLSVISQLTGLDNSYLLPPYFPALRGEDALFGAMLTMLQPDGIVLEFPWGVPHLPVDGRSFSVDDPIVNKGGMGLITEFVADLADYRATTTPEQNLTRLARELERLVLRTDEDLRLGYRAKLARTQVAMLSVFENRSSVTEEFKSTELQELLNRGIQEYREAILCPSSPLDIDGMPEGMTEAAFFARFREMVHGFAGALASWTEVRDVAAEVSQELVNSREMIPL